MTPRALKAWRLRLDLSQDGLAHWLGVSRSTVNRWEGGLAPIPKMVGMLAHRTAVPVVDDLACETECGCIQGVQTCNYHIGRPDLQLPHGRALPHRRRERPQRSGATGPRGPPSRSRRPES